MLLTHTNRRICLSLLFLIAVFAVETGGQQSELGKVDFPTSGSESAQAHFLQGVAALHSFWYEEALEAFRESTKADLEFMMGYWGEAMALNHPLWEQQDTEGARKILEKIKETPKLTPRERAYLGAVEVLYGKGDKLARDMAYASAMERIYRQYPDDLEAACFYALSLLGTVRPGDKGYRRQMQAGAIALEVYQKNPDHPGAAHYVIHAFDDPEHAILALPAARRYAEIAPAAHHAQHMPAHIFLQQGMWPEAAASNESAWAVSEAWVKRKGLSISRRDYHSLHWLLYVYLQQGRQREAEKLLSLIRQTIVDLGGESALRRPYYAEMAAVFVVETERWDLADRLFSAPGADAEVPEPESKAEVGEHAAHGHTRGASDTKTATASPSRGQILAVFIRGLAAAARGLVQAEESIAELRTIRQQLMDRGEPQRGKLVEIMELEVGAVANVSKVKYTEAIELMKRATALEEELSPPSGPPDMIKPSHELFGEILLMAGQAEEGAKQFSTALLRQKNRARSLLGAARAAALSGDRAGAVDAYSKFLSLWERADADWPELREGRDYLKRSTTN